MWGQLLNITRNLVRQVCAQCSQSHRQACTASLFLLAGAMLSIRQVA